jgi:hypothetical protein
VTTIALDQFSTYEQIGSHKTSIPAPPDGNARLPGTKSTQLNPVDATFNRPDHLRVAKTVPVELVLHQKPKIGDLFGGLPGPLVTKRIQVGDAVSATLTADRDMLQITPRLDNIQTFNGANLTWLWDVKPLKPGKTLVTLEVLSHSKQKDIEQVSKVRALQETWEITAEGLEWVKYYWNEYDWLRTAIYGTIAAVVAALGYFGFKGWGKKSDASPDC